MLALASGASFRPTLLSHNFKFHVGNFRHSLRAPRCQAEGETQSDDKKKKKVVVVGGGWAGVGAAHHLSKQGFDVTLLEAGKQSGGLVAGWKTASGRSAEVGIHGFWYPYRNIFSLIDELGISPFTNWTRSAQYSPNGLEVESPIFQDLPRLPSPLGTFVYTQFYRLPLVDRLSSLPLMYAMIDFDNTDNAWKKYDNLTAQELFKQFGCSRRVYEDAFNPMLLVGLFAPGEQCSAAATLGMLYYFILAHQQDFDVVWCRGTVGEKIFKPWVERIKTQGCQFLANKRVTDLVFDENTGTISAVACGDELFPADAVIFSVGITALQKIVSNSSALQTRDEFLNVLNLGAIDVLAVRLWLDRKVNIPKPSNACFGFDNSTGWTFFDLTTLHDEYINEPGTVVEADFYHANQFLSLKDEQIVHKVKAYLTTCIKDFGEAKVIDQAVVRFSKSVTHFFPGFWYPYRNIFSLIDELGISPFTNWTRSAQYSPNGLEVESPIFQDLPRLPSPLGTFVYTQFYRLPLVDRLSSLPLMYAMIDFDNTDNAWKKYDNLTARELFKQFGCSRRVYEDAFNPMLLVGLFAPGEQCSAAATLGMLYYFILAHQAWCSLSNRNSLQ